MSPDNHRDNEHHDTKASNRTPDRRITDPARAEDISVSPSALFGILADARQRYVLYYLIENNGVGELEEIATRLAAWENDTTVELTTAEMTNRVRGGLFHADLPKLQEYGFIEYDQESGHVVATEQTEEIIPYLEMAEQFEQTVFTTGLEQLRNQRSQGSGPEHT